MDRDIRPILVLSGGAARGVAHLGVLAAMEERGLRPKAIVGTSAGALAGALYSSWDCTTGTPLALIRDLTPRRILRFAFSRRGIFSGDRVRELLEEALPRRRFEELPVPLYAVVTNWSRRTLETLSQGEIAPAVAASSALPPLFTPVTLGGMDYLDGGVLSILPAREARRIFPGEVIVGVDVNVHPGEKGRGTLRSRSRENWLTMATGPLWLSVARASLLERTFADATLLVPTGSHPLFSLSSIEEIYGIGYNTALDFFRRKEEEGVIFGKF
ncbi:MAG: patatin-like phospholipase family protein [Leptospirillia bacterium]